MMLGEALKTGVFSGPSDGKVSWTTHDDLAEAAAFILTNEGKFEGPTPPLTGPEALDFADLCELASQITARPIRRETTTEDQFRSKRQALGLPSRVIDVMLGLYAASSNGEFSKVDPTLERLLARRRRTMREVIAESTNS